MGEILLAAVIVLADQLSKVGAVDLAARRGSTVLIPGVIGLTCTYNYGASWGILSGKTVFLLVVTALVCAAISCADPNTIWPGWVWPWCWAARWATPWTAWRTAS